jgi:hypothetical protein
MSQTRTHAPNTHQDEAKKANARGPLIAEARLTQLISRLRRIHAEVPLRYRGELAGIVEELQVTVELLEHDTCIGRPCPTCGLLFTVGDKVTGDNLHHAACEGSMR